MFDFVIKQETSSVDLEMGGYFHLDFGNLVKSKLTRYELTGEQVISGNSFFPTKPHLYQRTTTISRTLGRFQPLISLNIGNIMAQAPEPSV